MTAPVPLDRIVIDGGTQMRVTMSAEHVADLVAVLASGATLPAVDVVQDPERGFYLVDGFHRFAAHREAGRKVITANVLDGETRADAIWHAAGRNLVHGLRRTNADKRKAVRAALEVDDEASDRRIAEHCGVGHPLVAEVRAAMEADRKPPEPVQVEDLPPAKRKGRDGKAYPLPRPPKVPAEAKAVAVTAAVRARLSSPVSLSDIEVAEGVASSLEAMGAQGMIAPAEVSGGSNRDDLGQPIPEALGVSWQRLTARTNIVLAGLKEARAGVAALKTLTASNPKALDSGQRDALHRFGADLDAMMVRAEGYRPHAVCVDGPCSRCKGRGWMTKAEHLAMVRGQEAKR